MVNSRLEDAEPDEVRALIPSPDKRFVVRRVEASELGLNSIDLERRNVLVLHGIGGVGKSKLGTRLRAWILNESSQDNRWGQIDLPNATRLSACFFDAGGIRGFDVTQVLLALRAGARPLDVQLRAFDLGLRTYWTAAGLGAVPAESGLRHATGIEIAEQVNASVADTLGELGLKFGLAGFSVPSCATSRRFSVSNA